MYKYIKGQLPTCWGLTRFLIARGSILPSGECQRKSFVFNNEMRASDRPRGCRNYIPCSWLSYLFPNCRSRVTKHVTEPGCQTACPAWEPFSWLSQFLKVIYGHFQTLGGNGWQESGAVSSPLFFFFFLVFRYVSDLNTQNFPGFNDSTSQPNL